MRSAILAMISAAVFLVSCESKAGTGAIAGAGLGAASGALITGTGGGALIGGAIGAAGGALIGAALDDTDRRSMEQQSPRTLKKIDRGEQLSVDDIKKMSNAGLSDNVIISQIQATNSTFYLSTADIIDLKNSGVSQRVIDYMIQTGNQ
jgi:outer membrane lipoprotein SlyB